MDDTFTEMDVLGKLLDAGRVFAVEIIYGERIPTDGDRMLAIRSIMDNCPIPVAYKLAAIHRLSNLS